VLCTEFKCGFKTEFWDIMRKHYKLNHPEVLRPDKYFTVKARMRKHEK